MKSTIFLILSLLRVSEHTVLGYLHFETHERDEVADGQPFITKIIRKDSPDPNLPINKTFVKCNFFSLIFFDKIKNAWTSDHDIRI